MLGASVNSWKSLSTLSEFGTSAALSLTACSLMSKKMCKVVSSFCTDSSLASMPFCKVWILLVHNSSLCFGLFLLKTMLLDLSFWFVNISTIPLCGSALAMDLLNSLISLFSLVVLLALEYSSSMSDVTV